MGCKIWSISKRSREVKKYSNFKKFSTAFDLKILTPRVWILQIAVKNIVTSNGRYEILYGSLTLPLLNETVKRRKKWRRLQLPAFYFYSEYNLTSYRRRRKNKKILSSRTPLTVLAFSRVCSLKKIAPFNCCFSTVAWIIFFHSIFSFLIEALFLYIFFNFLYLCWQDFFLR